MPPASPAKRSLADNWLANTFDLSGAQGLVPEVDAREEVSEKVYAAEQLIPIFLSVGGILQANSSAKEAPSSTVSGSRTDS